MLKRKTLFESIFLVLFFLLSIPVNLPANSYTHKDENELWHFATDPSACEILTGGHIDELGKEGKRPGTYTLRSSHGKDSVTDRMP